jgi:hypothetical protein
LRYFALKDRADKVLGVILRYFFDFFFTLKGGMASEKPVPTAAKSRPSPGSAAIWLQ